MVERKDIKKIVRSESPSSKRSPLKSTQLRRYERVYNKYIRKLEDEKGMKNVRTSMSNKHQERKHHKNSKHPYPPSSESLKGKRGDDISDYEDESDKYHRDQIKSTPSSSSINPNRRRVRREEPRTPTVTEKKPRKKLTEYQKFVKNESKKVRYRSLSPKSRLRSIGREWTKIKDSSMNSVSK